MEQFEIEELGDYPNSISRALARLREGTEVLRTGGGVNLSAHDCNVLLNYIEVLDTARKSLYTSAHPHLTRSGDHGGPQ